MKINVLVQHKASQYSNKNKYTWGGPKFDIQTFCKIMLKAVVCSFQLPLLVPK